MDLELYSTLRQIMLIDIIITSKSILYPLFIISTGLKVLLSSLIISFTLNTTDFINENFVYDQIINQNLSGQ